MLNLLKDIVESYVNVKDIKVSAVMKGIANNVS